MSQIMVDPFNPTGYSLAELSVAINKLPNMYGLLAKLGLFAEQGIVTRSTIIENKNGVLNLLPSVTPGGPSTMGAVGKRQLRSFTCLHIPHEDVVLPEEVQGIRAFGQASVALQQATLMADKLQTMRNKHDITAEWLRMGALKGILLDGDGTTTRYNFYTEFDITPKIVDFVLTDPDEPVLSKCLTIKRHIESHLFGETMTGIRVLVSPEFYDAFTQHAQVKDAFRFYQANTLNMQTLGADYRTGFKFGDIIWQEYIAQTSLPDGTLKKFIATGEGHAFPEGTAQTFRSFYAPADFNETVNTVGMPIYAKQVERKFGRGWDLHTQSNPLMICMRPEVLVKVTKS